MVLAAFRRNFTKDLNFFGRHPDITKEGSNYSHATFMAGISVSKKKDIVQCTLWSDTDYDLLLNHTTISSITVENRAQADAAQALLREKYQFIN